MLDDLTAWLVQQFQALVDTILALLQDLFAWLTDTIIDLAIWLLNTIDLPAPPEGGIWAQLGAEVLQLCGQTGVWYAVGIVLAALAARFVLRLVPWVGSAFG